MKPAVRYYLILYNAIAFCCWLAYLFCFLSFSSKLFLAGWILLNIAQGLAVLEIFHALLKWVKSPAGSTIAQVSSRLLVLLLIDILISGEVRTTVFTAGIISVSIAWSVTEIVRYSFYFSQLMSNPPRLLLWFRYTFFIVLYPVGVIGEWLIIVTPFAETGFEFNAYFAFVLVLAASYIYYFPVLYRYMWKQRQLKL